MKGTLYSIQCTVAMGKSRGKKNRNRAAALWARQKEGGKKREKKVPGSHLQLPKLAQFALAQWTEDLGRDKTPLWRSLLSRVEAARAAYKASQNPNDIASVFASRGSLTL